MLKYAWFIAFVTQKLCKSADMSKDANHPGKEEFLRGEENFMEGATFVFDLLIHLVRKAVILHNHFVIQQMVLHFTFIRKKQMTKNQTDTKDLSNKKIPGHRWGMTSHSICDFKMPE